MVGTEGHHMASRTSSYEHRHRRVQMYDVALEPKQPNLNAESQTTMNVCLGSPSYASPLGYRIHCNRTMPVLVFEFERRIVRVVYDLWLVKTVAREPRLVHGHGRGRGGVLLRGYVDGVIVVALESCSVVWIKDDEE